MSLPLTFPLGRGAFSPHLRMASVESCPPDETAAAEGMPVQHVELPDDWRGDVEKPREEWCSTCLWDGVWEHLLARSEARTKRFGRVFAKSMLWSSASEGYICCAVLLGVLQEVGGGKYDCFTVGWGLARGALVAFEFEQEEPEPRIAADEEYTRWKLLTVGSAPVPPGMFGCRPDELPSLETGSETSVAWAKDRINECLLNHSHCRSHQMSSATGSYIPSRLLYIPPDPIEGIVLRLKESVPSDAKYVALSHCWGSRDKWPRCLTTNANYESQLRHIPWDNLPQTFGDTAIFARKLGVEYVWIDSMCIIQGDEKDWQRESTKMYSVYSNAYITFAAAAAHDSHDGLFSRRAPGSLVPLLTLGFQGKRYHLQAYRVPDERLEFENQVDKSSIVNPSYPLLARAWAFQERLVSPRVLFFGLEELLWECPTGRSCEEDTYSPPSWHEVDDNGITRWETFKHKYSTITETGQRMTSHWLGIVKSYNDLELSEPTDRLPAIAAIAQRFAERNPDDEYICGLWKSLMPLGLLSGFSVNQNLIGPHIDHGPSTTVQSDYIAPSWAWASVQGKVYGNSGVAMSIFAELTSVNLRYIDDDQFGRVGPGSSITIRAPVLDCVWNVKYLSSGTLEFWQSLSFPSLECTMSLRFPRECAPFGAEGTASIRFEREYATYSGLGRREAIEVCLLLIGTHSGPRRKGGWEALILRRIGDGGHYFRVGKVHEFRLVGVPVSGLKQVLEEAPVRECVIE